MSDFISILTHGRRLQAAVKMLSVSDLEEVKDKLDRVIMKKRDAEAEEAAAQAKKKDALEAIRRQLDEAGLDVSDLQMADIPTNRKKGQKRPVKYVLTDDAGTQHPWTGIGRMPRVFADALAAGKSLKSFSI